MSPINVILLGAAVYLIFSSFKAKEQPAITEPDVHDDDPTNNDPILVGKLLTASTYLNTTHPYFNQVPLFYKRFYTDKHFKNPFASASGVIPEYVSASSYMQSGIEIKIFEEADYQPNRKICRITNFQPQSLTDDMIMKYLENPEKVTKIHYAEMGISLPLSKVPTSTPFSMNVWVLKENIKQVSAAIPLSSI